MDIFTGIVVYMVIWWTVIFCVLPWGVVRDTGEQGGTGAPVNPHLKKKFWITTGVSLLVWLLVYGVIAFDVIDFRATSMQMLSEDLK